LRKKIERGREEGVHYHRKGKLAPNRERGGCNFKEKWNRRKQRGREEGGASKCIHRRKGGKEPWAGGELWKKRRFRAKKNRGERKEEILFVKECDQGEGG